MYSGNYGWKLLFYHCDDSGKYVGQFEDNNFQGEGPDIVLESFPEFSFVAFGRVLSTQILVSRSAFSWES